MNFIKYLYYWSIKFYSLHQNGSDLTKHQNHLNGKWFVLYADGTASKPCYWDVAYFKTQEEPGCKIVYMGPGCEYLKDL